MSPGLLRCNGCPPAAPIVPLQDNLPSLDGRVLMCVVEPPGYGFPIVLERPYHALEIRIRVTDSVLTHARRPYALGRDEARRSLGFSSESWGGSRLAQPPRRWPPRNAERLDVLPTQACWWAPQGMPPGGSLGTPLQVRNAPCRRCPPEPAPGAVPSTAPTTNTPRCFHQASTNRGGWDFTRRRRGAGTGALPRGDARVGCHEQARGQGLRGAQRRRPGLRPALAGSLCRTRTSMPKCPGRFVDVDCHQRHGTHNRR